MGTYDTAMLKKFSRPSLCLSCTKASIKGADSMSLLVCQRHKIPAIWCETGFKSGQDSERHIPDSTTLEGNKFSTKRILQIARV